MRHLRITLIAILVTGCAAPIAGEGTPTHGASEGDALSHRDAPELRPPSKFIDVDAAPGVVGAIAEDGALWVWGRDLDPIGEPGDFSEITVGQTVACGLSESGIATCIPLVEDCEDDLFAYCGDTPARRFSAISAGQDFVCGLDADDGGLSCWGRMRGISVLEGTYVSVAASIRSYCVVDAFGEATCVGSRRPGTWAETPEGRYESFVPGRALGCGVLREGGVRCERIRGGMFTDREQFVDFPYTATWPDSHPVHQVEGAEAALVALGPGHACALSARGDLRCFGDDRFGQTGEPSGRFADVAAGDDFTCGLRTDGTISCWGGDWSCRGPSDAVEGENECGSCGALPTVVGGACGCSGRLACGSPDDGLASTPYFCEEAHSRFEDAIDLGVISDGDDEAVTHRGLLSERSEQWFEIDLNDTPFGWFAGRIAVEAPPGTPVDLSLWGFNSIATACDGWFSPDVELAGRVTDRCDSEQALTTGTAELRLESKYLFSRSDTALKIRVRLPDDVAACVPYTLSVEL